MAVASNGERTMTDQPNVLVTDEDALDTALTLAHGMYQENLLRGYEALSGAGLKGKARQYGVRWVCSKQYEESRNNLLARMTAAGVPWCEIKGKHEKRILVIGTSDTEVAYEEWLTTD